MKKYEVSVIITRTFIEGADTREEAEELAQKHARGSLGIGAKFWTIEEVTAEESDTAEEIE